jgi:hypothetical protein
MDLALYAILGICAAVKGDTKTDPTVGLPRGGYVRHHWTVLKAYPNMRLRGWRAKPSDRGPRPRGWLQLDLGRWTITLHWHREPK